MRNWLTELRANQGKTQMDVAKDCGITNSYYSMIETGHRNPSPQVAKLIGNYLSFDWTVFFNSEKDNCQF